MTSGPSSLILHELTTNAVKYGALSTPTGEVQLSWKPDRGTPDVVLDWRERGGPPVVPPERSGFGTTLLAQLVTRKGLMDFEKDGLHVVTRFRASEDPDESE